jgi:UDP-N-acetylmuramate dehydrogenase
MGGGSNMLVSDNGIRGMVIKVSIKGVTWEPVDRFETLVHVGAGVVLDEFVQETVEKGYWGLENLSAIPGTVGATPIQNVGAYGVEVASRITSVEAFNMNTGDIRTFTNTECNFGYRHSFFKTSEGMQYVVLRVTFRLTKIPTPHVRYADLRRAFAEKDPTQQDIRAEVMRVRARKFPDWHKVGTAGSFFKNPRVSADAFAALRGRFPDIPGFPEEDGRVKVPLGWILDKALALRGARVGNVGTYEGQSLVIVNFGGATARDVDMFARSIEERVQEKTGIVIEREVRMYL